MANPCFCLNFACKIFSFFDNFFLAKKTKLTHTCLMILDCQMGFHTTWSESFRSWSPIWTLPPDEPTLRLARVSCRSYGGAGLRSYAGEKAYDTGFSRETAFAQLPLVACEPCEWRQFFIARVTIIGNKTYGEILMFMTSIGQTLIAVRNVLRRLVKQFFLKPYFIAAMLRLTRITWELFKLCSGSDS